MRASRDMLLELMARGEVDLVQVESDIPDDMLKHVNEGQTSYVVAVIGVLDEKVARNIRRIQENQKEYSNTLSGYLSNSVNQTICNAEIVESVPFDEALQLGPDGRFSINKGLSSQFFTGNSGIMTILPPRSSQAFESSEDPTFVAFSPYYHLEQLYGVPYDLANVRDYSEQGLEACAYGKMSHISRFQRVLEWDGVEDLHEVIARIDAMPDPVAVHMCDKGISEEGKTAQVTGDSRETVFAAREVP